MTSPFAPSDHFSLDSEQLTKLGARLNELRKAVPLLRRTAAGTHYGVISACAALLAYLPAHRLALKEGFWAAITAIAVVQTEYRAARTTARDQFVGAAIGGVIAVCLSVLAGSSPLLYAAAIILAMMSCWVLNVASASRLAAITATIVLLVPHPGSAELMFLSRLGEVGWGLCVAIFVVWLAGRLPTRHLRRAQAGSRAG
jgi:uncharacterized membrane protein YgaE (UPF0421/DUF939 family)